MQQICVIRFAIVLSYERLYTVALVQTERYRKTHGYFSNSIMACELQGQSHSCLHLQYVYKPQEC